MDADAAGFDMLAKRNFEGVAARINRAEAFIEGEDYSVLPAFGGRHGICQSDRGLSFTCASYEESTSAAMLAAA